MGALSGAGAGVGTLSRVGVEAGVGALSGAVGRGGGTLWGRGGGRGLKQGGHARALSLTHFPFHSGSVFLLLLRLWGPSLDFGDR